MSYPLGPVAVPDNYSEATTIRTMPCVRLTMWISNAPIYYQIRDAESADWGAEHYVPSANGETYFVSLPRRFKDFRCRNAIPANPPTNPAATIVAQLLTVDDLPSA